MDLNEATAREDLRNLLEYAHAHHIDGSEASFRETEAAIDAYRDAVTNGEETGCQADRPTVWDRRAATAILWAWMAVGTLNALAGSASAAEGDVWESVVCFALAGFCALMVRTRIQDLRRG